MCLESPLAESTLFAIAYFVRMKLAQWVQRKPVTGSRSPAAPSEVAVVAVDFVVAVARFVAEQFAVEPIAVAEENIYVIFS